MNTLALEDIDDEIPWSDQVTMVQRIINNNVNDSIGHTPSEVRYGFYNPGSSSMLCPPTDGTASDWIKKISNIQRKIVKDVADKESDTKRARTGSLTITTTFQPEELVLVDHRNPER